jgi:hypothetical protein
VRFQFRHGLPHDPQSLLLPDCPAAVVHFRPFGQHDERPVLVLKDVQARCFALQRRQRGFLAVDLLPVGRDLAFLKRTQAPAAQKARSNGQLAAQINSQKATLAALESKTAGLNIFQDKNGTFVVLPKGAKVDDSGWTVGKPASSADREVNHDGTGNALIERLEAYGAAIQRAAESFREGAGRLAEHVRIVLRKNNATLLKQVSFLDNRVTVLSEQLKQFGNLYRQNRR